MLKSVALLLKLTLANALLVDKLCGFFFWLDFVRLWSFYRESIPFAFVFLGGCEIYHSDMSCLCLSLSITNNNKCTAAIKSVCYNNRRYYILTWLLWWRFNITLATHQLTCNKIIPIKSVNMIFSIMPFVV